MKQFCIDSVDLTKNNTVIELIASIYYKWEILFKFDTGSLFFRGEMDINILTIMSTNP